MSQQGPFQACQATDDRYYVCYNDRLGKVQCESEAYTTRKEARQAAHIANKAYAMGQRDKAAEIRKALGVTNCGGRHAGGCEV